MTCVGDTIYVVKRLPDDQNIPYTDAYQQLHNNNTTNNASNNPVDSHQTAAAINVTNTNETGIKQVLMCIIGSNCSYSACYKERTGFPNTLLLA
ncbi:Ragulator complex protein [Schistosoma japonicum]|nr:Ragulator complex protein [Schistosoma japonicum]